MITAHGIFVHPRQAVVGTNAKVKLTPGVEGHQSAVPSLLYGADINPGILKQLAQG